MRLPVYIEENPIVNHPDQVAPEVKVPIEGNSDRFEEKVKELVPSFRQPNNENHQLVHEEEAKSQHDSNNLEDESSNLLKA